ncbi:hypothetical protein PPERSA_07666 [Pseudocohnilembus persalinus]|uniref:Uncharacterized protein n=1 Tax=Pseudocohnilembus persalinus TaxID=266149 RepID=A0A0V0QJ07_PSEPJ|nr:hypothetical protein PPERSA_07666 [Pseudocohnilembus persalinus]|eukprot:KRX02021.1 hypothetical protein PPERSA_07666 [Pseudocohnilembus persalinus]
MSIQKIKNSFNIGNKYEIQEKLILDFLDKHKTKKCQKCKNKKLEFKCSNFHDSEDFRRKQGYDVKMCNQGINCKDFMKCLEQAEKGEDYEISCRNSHNYYEIMYNYDYYRFQQCPYYYKCESSLQQLCPYYHSIDDQREIQEILYRKKLRQDITYEIYNIQDQSGYLKEVFQLENENIINDNKIKDQSQTKKVKNDQVVKKEVNILNLQEKNKNIQRDFLSNDNNFQHKSNGGIQNNQIIEETEQNEIEVEKIIDPKIKQNLDKKQKQLKQKTNRKKYYPQEDEEDDDDDDDEDDLDDEQQQQLNGLQKNNFYNNKNNDHNQEINQRNEQDNNIDKNKINQEQQQNEEQEIQTRYSYIQKQVFEEDNEQNSENQKVQNEKNLQLQKNNAIDLNKENDKQQKNNVIYKKDDNQHKGVNNNNNSDFKEKVKLVEDGKIQEQNYEFNDQNNDDVQNNIIIQDNFQDNQNMNYNQNMILQQNQQNNNREDTFIQEQDRTFVSFQEQQTHLQLLKIQEEYKEQQKKISELQKKVLEIQNQNLERNSNLYSQKKSQLKLDNNQNDAENELIDNNIIIQCDNQKEVNCQDIINRICGIFNNGAIQDEILDLQYQIKYSFFKGKRMDHAYKLIQNLKNQLGNCSKSIQIKNSVEIKLKDDEHNIQQTEIRNEQLNNDSTYFSLYFSVYIMKKNMKNIFKNQHDQENLKILNNLQQYFFAFNTVDYQEIKDEYQQLELQYSQNVIRIDNDYKVQLQEANKKILEKDQKIDDLEQQIKKKDLLIEQLIMQNIQQKH